MLKSDGFKPRNYDEAARECREAVVDWSEVILDQWLVPIPREWKFV